METLSKTTLFDTGLDWPRNWLFFNIQFLVNNWEEMAPTYSRRKLYMAQKIQTWVAHFGLAQKLGINKKYTILTQ